MECACCRDAEREHVPCMPPRTPLEFKEEPNNLCVRVQIMGTSCGCNGVWGGVCEPLLKIMGWRRLLSFSTSILYLCFIFDIFFTFPAEKPMISHSVTDVLQLMLRPGQHRNINLKYFCGTYIQKGFKSWKVGLNLFPNSV